MRYLAGLTTSLACFYAIAFAAEENPATKAYINRIATIVNRLVDSEISKHPERMNGVSVNLRYYVDRRGRVQDIKIISSKPDRLAANTVARAIKATSFPPFPNEVLQEHPGIDQIEGELNWTRSMPSTDTPGPAAVISIQQHRTAKYHPVMLAIAAVDGRPLKTPQQEVSLSPGRHVLSVRTWFIADGEKGQADAPLEHVFEAHRYTIEGEFSRTWEFTLHVTDETKRSADADRRHAK